MSRKKKEKVINRSIDYHRTKYKDDHYNIEKAFADEWEKQNECHLGSMSGRGLLQGLYLDPHPCASKPKWITNDERIAAATAIQWLGTNCGFSFLTKVLQKSGYKIITNELYERRQKAKWKKHEKEEKERLKIYNEKMLKEQKKHEREQKQKIIEEKQQQTWEDSGKMLAIIEEK